MFNNEFVSRGKLLNSNSFSTLQNLISFYCLQKKNNNEFESKKKTFPTSLYVGFINVSMYRAHKIHTEKVLFSERSALWNDHVKNKKDEKIAY